MVEIHVDKAGSAIDATIAAAFVGSVSASDAIVPKGTTFSALAEQVVVECNDNCIALRHFLVGKAESPGLEYESSHREISRIPKSSG